MGIFGAIKGGAQSLGGAIKQDWEDSKRLRGTSDKQLDDQEEMASLLLQLKKQELSQGDAAEGRREDDQKIQQGQADDASLNQFTGRANEGGSFSQSDFDEMESLGMDDQQIANLMAQSNFAQTESAQGLAQGDANLDATTRGITRADTGAMLDLAESGIIGEDTADGVSASDDQLVELANQEKENDSQRVEKTGKEMELLDARIEMLKQKGLNMGEFSQSEIATVLRNLTKTGSGDPFGRTMDDVTDEEIQSQLERMQSFKQGR